jgi:hypothetical protein
MTLVPSPCLSGTRVTPSKWPSSASPVQPSPGLPHHECPLRSCPVGDLGIVADDRDRKGTPGLEHPRRHLARELLTGSVAQGHTEAALGVRERLDGHEHCSFSQHAHHLQQPGTSASVGVTARHALRVHGVAPSRQRRPLARRPGRS